MSCNCNTTPFVGSDPFKPNDVRLYGFTPCPMDKIKKNFEDGNRTLNVSFGDCDVEIEPPYLSKIKSLGIIYGYAFEGHCYRLPRPRIMFLQSFPKKLKGGDDCCCYECGFIPELGFHVWSVDRLSWGVALDVYTDDIKTLVLDQNTPANRSPLAYAQTQSLAPQRSRDF